MWGEVWRMRVENARVELREIKIVRDESRCVGNVLCV